MDHVSPGPPASSVPQPGRRQFLKRGIALGAALAAPATGLGQPPPAPDDPSKVLGGPVRPYGERSRFERAERTPRGKTDEVAVGNRTPLDETLGAWWGSESDGFAARVETEQAWRVSVDEIKSGNYNLDLKNPHNPDEGPGDVEHLLPEYEKLLAQIAETRGALKRELEKSLLATAGSDA